MAGQDTLITKKKRGPAPTGQGTLIGVRLHPPDLAVLDSWISQQAEPRPSRPEALRTLMRAAFGVDNSNVGSMNENNGT